MEPGKHTLEKTISAIVEGNQHAFRHFYDLFYPSVYRFARYFLPRGEDCDEVVSEVFCLVWKNRLLIAEVENIQSYLYIICRNEAYRILKQQDKYRNISIDHMPVELTIHIDDIEGKIVEEELFKVYKRAVERLPERCKLIFLMVREQKLKYKEIAKILNITEGTIEQQMNIAIKKIVATVKKYYPSFQSK